MREFFRQFVILFHKCLKLKLAHPINTIFEITFPLQVVCFVFILRLVLTQKSEDLLDYYPVRSVHRNQLDSKKLAILSGNPTTDILKNFTSEFCPCSIEYVSGEDYLSHPREFSLGALDIKQLSTDIYGSETTRFLLINRTNIMDLNQTRRYSDSSLLELQYQISMKFFKLKNPNTNLMLNISTQEIPEKTSQDIINMAAEFMYPFYFAATALQIFHPQLVNLVNEKQENLKSLLLIFGCSMIAYNLSWYLISLLQIVITILSTTLLVYILGIFRYTNVFLFMGAYFLYLASFLPLANILSSFFSDTKSSSFVSQIVFIVCLFVWIVVRFILQFIHPWWLLMIVNSISPMAFLEFMYYLVCAENNGIGLNFSNLSTQDFDKNYDLRITLLSLLLDNIIYFFLSLYIDQVVREDSGRAQPIYFLLSPRFWFDFLKNVYYFITCNNFKLRWRRRNTDDINTRPFRINHESDGSEISDIMDELEQIDELLPSVNTDSEPQTPSVQIRGLTKAFIKWNLFGLKRQKTIALNELDLDIFPGINAITGHNASGKSTLCKILVSQLTATKGKIYIDGMLLNKHWKSLRSRICYCPQDNILWNKLSCADHLKIFGKIKGISDSQLKNKVDESLKLLNLYSKKNERVEKLSGGQKRRLSFLISMIGSKPGDVIVLDEVSSGVDASNRRKIWDMLQKIKIDRTVILITHSMEEADYLADSIAILKKGALEVCGNSLFLKKHYSIGYKLKCLINEQVNRETVEPMLTRLVKTHVPGATETESLQKNELCYTLPYEQTKFFSTFFKMLDISKSRLNIKVYSLSVRSLEEIFLKITEEIENINEDPQISQNELLNDLPRRSVHQRNLSQISDIDIENQIESV